MFFHETLTGADPGGGGGGTRRAPPLKLEKIRFFGVKSWFFTRNTPKIFAPPSAIGKNMIFCRKIVIFHTKSAPPPLTWNPGSAPDLEWSWNVIATTNIVESGAKHHNHSHICRYGDCNTLKFPHVNTTVHPIKCIEEKNTLPLMVRGESEYRPLLVVGAVVAVIIW